MNPSAIAREALDFPEAIHYAHRRSPSVATTTPVLLMLDTRGRVQFCSDPDALQRPEAEIVGRHVGELIEGMPLRATTPGYNVAWVRFAFEGETRRRLGLRLPSGGVRAIDVGVRALRMDRSHCLLVQLRFAGEASAPAAEPVRLHPRSAAEACC